MVNSLAYLITKYFGEHLPLQVGASPNTIRSYRDTMVQFLEYLGLDSPRTTVELKDLNEAIVSRFLLHLGNRSVSDLLQNLSKSSGILNRQLGSGGGCQFDGSNSSIFDAGWV